MLVAMVKSNDPAKMIEATGRIRKLLSIGARKHYHYYHLLLNLASKGWLNRLPLNFPSLRDRSLRCRDEPSHPGRH